MKAWGWSWSWRLRCSMCRWVVGGGHRGKAGKLQRQESWQAAATADVWGGGQVVGPRRELDVLWSEFSLIFCFCFTCYLLPLRPVWRMSACFPVYPKPLLWLLKPPLARTSEDCYPVAVLIRLYFQCFEQTQALALIKVAWTTKPFSISMKRATMTPSNVRRLIRCISSYLPCFLITL